MKEHLKELTAKPKMNPLTIDKVIIQISQIAPPMIRYKKKIMTDSLVCLNCHAVIQYKHQDLKKGKISRRRKD